MVKPYGCHSKPRSEGYWANAETVFDPKSGTMIRLARWVKDTMSQECNYRKSTPDQRCEGCKCP